MKTIAVLLTVFNRKEQTLKCLRNLHAQLPIEGYDVDVYLTNDGCTDGTIETIAEAFSQVNIINGSGDLFWNRGMYTAWEKAAHMKDYDFYLWLNDDTFIYSDSLKNLLNDSQNTNNQSIICGPTCSKHNGKITYGGRSKKGLIIPNGELQRCSHFNGNVVLIPKYVYQKVGNLDFRYSHALGDFDYGLRANKQKIASYQSRQFIGTCERHAQLEKWCNSDYPFKERIKVFHTPLGGHPNENFYFERKHFGIIQACFHYLTIHLRVLMPKIWKNKQQ